jgi:AraC family transcriptional regulator
MLEEPRHNLLVASVQLVEAACHARDGDSEAARAHIAHAVALLDGHPGSPLAAVRSDSRRAAPARRGGFVAWQARKLAVHIDANLAGKICIKHLATFVGVSISHFCSLFKRTFGVPARVWITRRRIEVAQGLMLTTNAPLSEIALSCGMSDQSHFTRSFRCVVGETPFTWRKTRRAALAEDVSEVADVRTTAAIPTDVDHDIRRRVRRRLG